MRLSPAENRKLTQTHQMDFYFGGTEMNVAAASLSYFGEHTQQVTNVSKDLVGEAAIAQMRQYGIDTSAISKVDHPLGLYFLEVGSGMRASKIAYVLFRSRFRDAGQ